MRPGGLDGQPVSKGGQRIGRGEPGPWPVVFGWAGEVCWHTSGAEKYTNTATARMEQRWPACRREREDGDLSVVWHDRPNPGRAGSDYPAAASL